MRNYRLLIGLFVIFAVLLAAVLLLGEPGAETDPVQPTMESLADLQRIFPELEVLNIAAIQLQNPANDEEFTIARRLEDGAWTAPGYPDQTLDSQAATLIARTIALMPYRDSFQIDEETDLRQYGFRPNGDFFIKFVTIEGEEHIIAVGEPAFESDTFYSLLDDEQTMYLIQRAPIDFLVDIFLEPPVN